MDNLLCTHAIFTRMEHPVDLNIICKGPRVKISNSYRGEI